ncbi:MAG: [FeFe] hydrogenase H-cluster radical SAM maturase HydE [Armatimonadia bacterium]
MTALTPEALSAATAPDLAALLETSDPAVADVLLAAADTTRREHLGDGVQLRALIEFSNHCTRTCHYCGLRAANEAIPRYRMPLEEIVQAALRASALGYQTVVLQSGEDPWYTCDRVSWLVREIKAQTGTAITLCLGERPRDHYAAWRDAGADRYLLRIETSSSVLYHALHPGMSFGNRLRCLQTLKALGYQLGSGILIGLPGQTPLLLAKDLLFLRDLQPDMVGMGPFISHPQTPLAHHPGGALDLTLRMMALARLLLPGCHLVATTALGSLDPLGRERGLQVGANVLMPNATPRQYRADYEIYPNKICLDEEPEHCRGCIERRLNTIGRHVASGLGHATRLEQQPCPTQH